MKKDDDKNSLPEEIDYSRREFVSAFALLAAATPLLCFPRLAFAKPQYNFGFWRNALIGTQLRTTLAFAQVMATYGNQSELRSTLSFAQVGAVYGNQSELRTTLTFAQVLCVK